MSLLNNHRKNKNNTNCNQLPVTRPKNKNFAFFSRCFILIATFCDWHKSLEIVWNENHLKSTEWQLRKTPDPLECWFLNFSYGRLYSSYDRLYSLKIYCSVRPQYCFKYLAIRIKRYFNITFQPTNNKNLKALGKTQPNRNCSWYSATGKVSGRNQRSQSLHWS